VPKAAGVIDANYSDSPRGTAWEGADVGGRCPEMKKNPNKHINGRGEVSRDLSGFFAWPKRGGQAGVRLPMQARNREVASSNRRHLRNQPARSSCTVAC